MLMLLLRFLLLFLLAVLLLLLLVLMLLLFVPVRYSLDLERREAEAGHAQFSLHWLFRAAELKGGCDRDGFRWRLQVLHHTIKESEEDEQD